jgi:arginase family enzyme
MKLKISNLEKPNNVTGPTAVCIDLTAFKAEVAPGVSEPNPVSGFLEHEMIEVLLDLVEQKRDTLVAITEFNPAIEKVRTGQTIVTLFETLINGWLRGLTHTN